MRVILHPSTTCRGDITQALRVALADAHCRNDTQGERATDAGLLRLGADPASRLDLGPGFIEGAAHHGDEFGVEGGTLGHGTHSLTGWRRAKRRQGRPRLPHSFMTVPAAR
ncbi:MAG: hypothetical protein WDN31_21830 [Hyphomicrobium sp.]